MYLTELALRRAGAATLREFQRREGLSPSGKEDVLTFQRLAPWLLGYVRHTVQPGENQVSIARRYGTTPRAIRVANPRVLPNRLLPGSQLIVPLGFDVVPTEIPFTSQVLSLCLEGLKARYPFLTRQVIATTAGGRPVETVRIGEGTRTLLYNASHHANEWITTPVLMKFLEQYARAVAFGEQLYDLEAQALYRRTQLYLVPMVNPDGVDLVTGAVEQGSGEYLQALEIGARYPAIPFPTGWKANLAGVDLNLNYPAGWEQARENKFALGFTGPAPRDYVGTEPLDQPETAAMTRLTVQVNPRLTLSYHTQGEVIYWRFQSIEPLGAEEIGQRFAQASGYLLEDTPLAAGFGGYKDWFLQTYDRPGYTIEAGLGENPLPLDQFDEIYRKNLGILALGLQL